MRAGRAQSSAATHATVLSSVEKLHMPTKNVSPERDWNIDLNSSKASHQSSESFTFCLSVGSHFFYLPLPPAGICKSAFETNVLTLESGLSSYYLHRPDKGTFPNHDNTVSHLLRLNTHLFFEHSSTMYRLGTNLLYIACRCEFECELLFISVLELWQTRGQLRLAPAFLWSLKDQ